MKKLFAIGLITTLFSLQSAAQTETETPVRLRPSSLGISFFFNDFYTPRQIRSGSLASAIRDKQVARFREMTPGLAISYFKGLKNRMDFAATIAASYADDVLQDQASGTNNFLLELDASVNLKLVGEEYWLIPYISGGVGISNYKSRVGAFVPIGGGLRINFFDEASLNFTSQYRVPVTTQANNYHFMHSIGISGIIGK